MTVSVVSAHNLREACRITRGFVAMHPVKRDVIPRYEAVQAWALVAPLYSGVEQALKLLLLAAPDEQFTLPQLKTDYGHDLKKLYSALNADDRAHIELHFREHWSLYGYNTHGANITTAEQFIAHINGASQDGFFAWRYFLIDETMKMPSTSPLTMSEIWDATCCCIQNEVSDQPEDCSRLSRRLLFEFDDLRFGRNIPYDDYSSDIAKWCVHMNGDPLAAWIDLLVKVSSGARHEVQAPDRLRLELAKMASAALSQMASDSADPDEAVLLYRIKTEPNLAWDPTDGTFHGEPSI